MELKSIKLYVNIYDIDTLAKTYCIYYSGIVTYSTWQLRHLHFGKDMFLYKTAV